MITGTRIDASALAAIYSVERVVRDNLGARIVRCRKGDGLVRIELDEAAYARLDDARRDLLSQVVLDAFSAAECKTGLKISFAPYAMGSAFVGTKQTGPRIEPSHG